MIHGTAAHAAEPRCYGALENYVDLGRFCDSGALKDKYGDIIELNRIYKSHYARAYSYIRAACGVYAAAPVQNSEAAAQLAKDFADNTLAPIRPAPGRVWKRFLTAFTHKGVVDYTHSGNMTLTLTTEKGVDSSAFLTALCSHASAAGYECILGMDPLIPTGTAALILPDIDVLITGESHEGRLERLDKAISKAALSAARKQLATAKVLHDELEAIYIPTIDFAGLTDCTNEHIDRLKAMLQNK